MPKLRVAGTTFMGVRLTHLCEKTRSLTAPMLAHGISNSIQLLVGVLGVLPPIIPGGHEFLSMRYVLIGIALLVVYIAFTRWFVRRTGGRNRIPPWLSVDAQLNED